MIKITQEDQDICGYGLGEEGCVCDRKLSDIRDIKKFDFIARKGDTFYRTMEFWSDECEKQGAIDQTGFRYDMFVVSSCSDTPLLVFTTNNNGGINIKTGTTNILEFKKTAIEMHIPSGIYRYDIQRTTTSDGTVKTIQSGMFHVEQDITDL